MFANEGIEAAVTTTYTLTGNKVSFFNTFSSDATKNNVPIIEHAFRGSQVYLEGVTDGVLGTSGHVFGRLGQGAATTSTGVSPFLWVTAASTTKAGMLVGFYPTTDADSGLATAKKVNISFKAKTWATFSSFGKPERPGAAKEPMAAGASMLALGATSALVLAALT